MLESQGSMVFIRGSRKKQIRMVLLPPSNALEGFIPPTVVVKILGLVSG